MENGTHRYEILKIEGLQIAHNSTYPVFVLLLLSYLFIMVSNIGIVIMIAMEKALHKPMYLLFCNLSVSDALTATVVLPGILKDILVKSERYISYSACVIQAFLVHTLGSSSITVLIMMAFDRYMAICNPLRYHTIMTNRMVVKLSAIAWVYAAAPVIPVIALSVRLSHCTSTVSNPYCDNPSLFKLSCENIIANQVFGFIVNGLWWAISISSISLTYGKIAHVCLKNRNDLLKSKAIRTCSTHLTVFLITITCSFLIIILHRFSDYKELRKLSSLLMPIIPTSLNPFIYGIQTKEIRHLMKQIFLRRKIIPQ